MGWGGDETLLAFVQNCLLDSRGDKNNLWGSAFLARGNDLSFWQRHAVSEATLYDFYGFPWATYSVTWISDLSADT